MKFISYLRSVRAELTHVVWPTRRQTIAHTLLVILISAVTAVIIGILDYLLSGAVSRLVA